MAINVMVKLVIQCSQNLTKGCLVFGVFLKEKSQMAAPFLQFLQSNLKAQLATFEIVISLIDGIPPAHAEQKDIDKANEYIKGTEHAFTAQGSPLTRSRLKNAIIMTVFYSSFHYIPWVVFLKDIYHQSKDKKVNQNDKSLLSLLSFSKIEKIGLGINLFGILLRSWSKLTLSNLFTYVVTIQDDHKLIKSGPYSLIRHPSYTGLLLQVYGNLIFFRNWYSAAFAYYFSWMFIFNRIPHEEKVLSMHYKKDWEEYKKKTWALFPPIY